MTVVVDTSVWVSFLRRTNTEAVRKLKAITPKSDIIVGDLVLLEILQGARDVAHASRLEAELRNFSIEEMMDRDIAVDAARHYRRLRGMGITVRKTVDLAIATFCIADGHQLLHDDRDFVSFEQHLGLRCL